MSLITPSIPPAAPGQALTVGAWNSMAAAIEGLYAVAGAADRDYVEVDVTWRGAAVPGARVTALALDAAGKPLPGGHPLPAVAPIGDITRHVLVGIRSGKWSIEVAARGFATATHIVDITAVPAASGRSAKLSVPLSRTTVPAPDVVGLTGTVAGYVLQWARHAEVSNQFSGGWEVFLQDLPIVIQSPAGVEIPRGTTINTRYASRSAMSSTTPPPPLATTIRTIVPDWIGVPVGRVFGEGGSAAKYVLFTTPRGAFTPQARVIAQDTVPGEVVPVGTQVLLDGADTDLRTMTFGTFPGTHPALKDRLVSELAAKLKSDKPLAATVGSLAPWSIVRTYVADDYLDAILAFFAQFDAKVADPATDLEAIWRSLNVTTAAMPPG